MFAETTIFYIKIWNHPIETTIYKWVFGVPGTSFKHQSSGGIFFEDWINLSTWSTYFLVGDFNPFEKYGWNWIISPGRGENKNYSKPPPSFSPASEPKIQKSKTHSRLEGWHRSFGHRNLPYCGTQTGKNLRLGWILGGFIPGIESAWLSSFAHGDRFRPPRPGVETGPPSIRGLNIFMACKMGGWSDHHLRYVPP